MATDDTVAYVHKQKDGRLVFHRADGSEVVVSQEPHETDDPSEIAYLDSLDAVKRLKSSGKEE
jgi:hypothetical protein